MRRLLIILLALCLLPLGLPAGAVQLEVAGKSALLMDAATGRVLYENNAHQPLPPASVTKVMTMLLIMEAIDSGKIGWNDMVTASETAAAKGGSQIYLKAGRACLFPTWSSPSPCLLPMTAPAPWQNLLPVRKGHLWRR